MTTPADALQVLTIVAACHRRTAPRMDDRDAAMATAAVWAELFNAHDLTVNELVDAVKSRATVCPDAPEPADIIRIARAKRNDQLGRAPTESEPNQGDGDRYPGETKAAEDLAEYPTEWGSDQRLRAYWYAIRIHAIPRTTTGWRALMAQLDAENGVTIKPQPPQPVSAEHPPGLDCASPGCHKPSTFGEFCAKHYVLHGAYSKRGPTTAPALSLSEVFERTADEIIR